MAVVSVLAEILFIFCYWDLETPKPDEGIRHDEICQKGVESPPVLEETPSAPTEGEYVADDSDVLVRDIQDIQSWANVGKGTEGYYYVVQLGMDARQLRNRKT